MYEYAYYSEMYYYPHLKSMGVPQQKLWDSDEDFIAELSKYLDTFPPDHPAKLVRREVGEWEEIDD